MKTDVEIAQEAVISPIKGIAAKLGIDEDNLECLRGMCVDEVSKLGGKFKFEDAVRIQKG